MDETTDQEQAKLVGQVFLRNVYSIALAILTIFSMSTLGESIGQSRYDLIPSFFFVTLIGSHAFAVASMLKARHLSSEKWKGIDPIDEALMMISCFICYSWFLLTFPILILNYTFFRDFGGWA